MVMLPSLSRTRSTYLVLRLAAALMAERGERGEALTARVVASYGRQCSTMVVEVMRLGNGLPGRGGLWRTEEDQAEHEEEEEEELMGKSSSRPSHSLSAALVRVGSEVPVSSAQPGLGTHLSGRVQKMGDGGLNWPQPQRL